MKKTDLNLVPPRVDTGSSSAPEKSLENITIDGPLPDDEAPKPPHGSGGVALPVPEPLEEQWATSLAAFEAAAGDMSRAARHVQMIRYPLESLARDIAQMSRDITGVREELAQFRQNLVPPIAVEPISTKPLLVKHDGPLPTQTSIRSPGISRRVKSFAWKAAQAIVGALAAWGAMQLLGWFWPELFHVNLAQWLK